jgi:hypothetical protein
MEHLSSKTVKELKEYAKENGINLKGATTKTTILSTIMGFNASVTGEPVPEQTIITHPEPGKRTPVSSTGSNDDGAIISRPAENNKYSVKKTTETQKADTGKVAVYSKKNLRWSEVGQLNSGYNIVTKEAAEKWVTLNGVRKATAEEVASYYGKV